MNAGLDRAQCSIRYTSVDMASQIISQLGAGTQLAKPDLKDAYRIVPVHLGDRPLLGMQWKKTLYVDMVLPFGLRSAPKIFSAVADGLMWIMHSNGALPSLHYLDDYLLLGRPATNDCGEALRTVLSLCEELGVPVAPEKTEGPKSTLTFLGIEIDAQALQLRLPEDKLADLKARLAYWGPGPSSRQVGKKERPALTHWGPTSCCKGHQTGTHICEEPHRCLDDSEVARPPRALECTSARRYHMVAPLCAVLERDLYPPSPSARPLHVLGRVRVMGSRCTVGKRVVSLPVASVMGRCSHIPEGDGSNRGCSGHLGRRESVPFLR